MRTSGGVGNQSRIYLNRHSSFILERETGAVMFVREHWLAILDLIGPVEKFFSWDGLVGYIAGDDYFREVGCEYDLGGFKANLQVDVWVDVRLVDNSDYPIICQLEVRYWEKDEEKTPPLTWCMLSFTYSSITTNSFAKLANS